MRSDAVFGPISNRESSVFNGLGSSWRKKTAVARSSARKAPVPDRSGRRRAALRSLPARSECPSHPWSRGYPRFRVSERKCSKNATASRLQGLRDCFGAPPIAAWSENGAGASAGRRRRRVALQTGAARLIVIVGDVTRRGGRAVLPLKLAAERPAVVAHDRNGPSRGQAESRRGRSPLHALPRHQGFERRHHRLPIPKTFRLQW